MAPKVKKSKKAVAGGAKKSVSIDMVKDAVAALGERNGSSINAIFNYLVRSKKVSPSSRTLVVLALGRACREGSMAKKSPNAFVLKAGAKGKLSSPKQRKRKAKRGKKSARSASRRRRQQRKRRNLKKTKKRSTKKRSRKVARKASKKAKGARKSRKAMTPKAIKTRKTAIAARRKSPRKATRRHINYRV